MAAEFNDGKSFSNYLYLRKIIKQHHGQSKKIRNIQLHLDWTHSCNINFDVCKSDPGFMVCSHFDSQPNYFGNKIRFKILFYI